MAVAGTYFASDKTKPLHLKLKGIMKTNETNETIKSHLHRNFGLYAVYAAGAIILLLQLRSIFA